MTAEQYLLHQAEHCRRRAEDVGDPFVRAELRQLAEQFESRAQTNVKFQPRAL